MPRRFQQDNLTVGKVRLTALDVEAAQRIWNKVVFRKISIVFCPEKVVNPKIACGSGYNSRVEDERDRGAAENLSAQLDQRRIDFLTLELKTCFTLANVAETEIRIGDSQAAKSAIAKAEKGYETINRFITDPKHVSHMKPGQIHELKAELGRLRERLDGLRSGS